MTNSLGGRLREAPRAVPHGDMPDRQCPDCGSALPEGAEDCPECLRTRPDAGSPRGPHERRYGYHRRRREGFATEAVWLLVMLAGGLAILLLAQVVAYLRSRGVF